MTTLILFYVIHLTDGRYDYKSYKVDLANNTATELLEEGIYDHFFLVEASINLTKLNEMYRSSDFIFRTINVYPNAEPLQD